MRDDKVVGSSPLVPVHRTASRRSVLKVGGALAVAGLSAPVLGAAGRPITRVAAQGEVSIRVTDAPIEDAAQAEKDFYDDLVSQFEQANPGVTVEAIPGGYGGPEVFAAKVAGGTLEDGFAVWFTEPQRIIRQGIAADITDQVRDRAPFNAYVPENLAVFSNPDGRIYGLPVSVYALSLVYNRALFEQAGLDPNRPPTTWDELRSTAKQITEETGTPGFAFLSVDNQGGWHFTTMLYTFGVDPLRDEGGRLVPAFNGEEGVRALQLLKDMRWADNSLTEQQQLNQGLVAEALATGQVAMGIGGVPSSLVETYGANLTDYGLGIVPQGGGNAVLGGGYGWMFNADSTPEQIEAAIDWVAFRHFDPAIYQADLNQANARGLTVGFPEPALFTGKLQEQREAARAAAANVPVELYQPYVEGMQNITVRAEPTGLDVQRYYATLDPAVQAVLTDENADPQALLDEAARNVQAIIDEGA
ncbi:MAG: ABC transporter, substrate-binding protein (cluster 1, maltose/g3p/polyamine/iron) [uncultured Thermomicrobiales bacterium]|uniref:ABC transporter, substrate-binding protein (Cluster 1, maltose/g3p/polyamine/iron) n=1 Tax=uncultured Thermomicrobiales bacterium TaxID=1645740 RepID=A0A6J4UX33_9BACT|nr:MAG: ABC transporter, substrate-binding protein (cluster 1, maltose/g3p/polyamine/iron) [uncultured Thermomicrobiales bacterium]